jgi:hypothetical protein
MLGLSGGTPWPCADAGNVPLGDPSGSGGGDIGYICEVRREAVVELWRDSEPLGLLVTLGRGEVGTEFRSGAMMIVSCSCSCLRVYRSV